MSKPSESTFELICSLCPKAPKFSDISHLLTHISSKTHLSHHLNLQLLSTSDPDAKAKYDNYNFWYSNNKLTELLRERLNTKNQKKCKKERKTRANSIASVKQEKSLVNHSCKNDSSIYRAPFKADFPRIPNMHYWPRATEHNDWAQSVYETPTARREVPNFTRHGTPIEDNLDPDLMTPWKPEYSDDAEKLTDSTKLKGVVLPGMNLFDSATPEMKRMRNQRKDAYVLEQMKATSAQVEPAEISYHANGEFRGSRDIFGPVSLENSPEPTPKKRKPRKAIATLADKSVNVPHIRNFRSNKIANVDNSELTKLLTIGDGDALLFNNAPAAIPLAGWGHRQVSTSEEDEEFRLTLGAFSKTRRPLSVFQDGFSEASPVRTESPLEDHRFDFPNLGMPQYPNLPMSSNFMHASPTPTPKLSGFRISGKENKQPQISSEQSRRVSSPTSNTYPSQAFHQSCNPLFGYSFISENPFTCEDQQNTFENRSFSTYSSAFHRDLRQVTQTQHVNPMSRSQQFKGTSGSIAETSLHDFHFGCI